MFHNEIGGHASLCAVGAGAECPFMGLGLAGTASWAAAPGFGAPPRARPPESLSPSGSQALRAPVRSRLCRGRLCLP